MGHSEKGGGPTRVSLYDGGVIPTVLKLPEVRNNSVPVIV